MNQPGIEPEMRHQAATTAIAAALVLAASSWALSGRVHTASDAPLPDVRIVLAGTNQSAWTDSSGSWSLEPTSLATRRSTPSASGTRSALHLQARTLAIRPGGRTVLGQRIGEPNPAVPAPAPAARAAGAPDSLLYVVAGRIVARKAIFLDDPAILHQVLDTAGVGGSPWNTKVPYGILRDGRDGRTYRTIQAGGRTWMAENLDFQPPGTQIPWAQGSIDSGMKYGRHYTWLQALTLDDSCTNKSCSTLVNRNAQGLCPAGWELPTADDWSELSSAVGGSGEAGAHLKALAGWRTEGGSDDQLGFRALPAGRRDTDGAFRYLGTDAYWWSSTENSRFDAVQRNLSDDGDAFYQGTGKTDGFSVRCVQRRP